MPPVSLLQAPPATASYDAAAKRLAWGVGLLDPLHQPLLPPRDDQAGHPLPAAASALPVELVVAVGAQVSPSRVRRQHWAHAGAEPGPGPEPEPELFQRAPEAEGTAELRQRFESTPTSLGIAVGGTSSCVGHLTEDGRVARGRPAVIL
jgi:hypothetical protein